MSTQKADKAIADALAALEAEMAQLGPAEKGAKRARSALNASVARLREAVGKV